MLGHKEGDRSAGSGDGSNNHSWRGCIGDSSLVGNQESGNRWQIITNQGSCRRRRRSVGQGDGGDDDAAPGLLVPDAGHGAHATAVGGLPNGGGVAEAARVVHVCGAAAAAVVAAKGLDAAAGGGRREGRDGRGVSGGGRPGVPSWCAVQAPALPLCSSPSLAAEQGTPQHSALSLWLHAGAAAPGSPAALAEAGAAVEAAQGADVGEAGAAALPAHGANGVVVPGAVAGGVAQAGIILLAGGACSSGGDGRRVGGVSAPDGCVVPTLHRFRQPRLLCQRRVERAGTAAAAATPAAAAAGRRPIPVAAAAVALTCGAGGALVHLSRLALLHAGQPRVDKAGGAGRQGAGDGGGGEGARAAGGGGAQAQLAGGARGAVSGGGAEVERLVAHAVQAPAAGTSRAARELRQRIGQRQAARSRQQGQAAALRAMAGAHPDHAGPLRWRQPQAARQALTA